MHLMLGRLFSLEGIQVFRLLKELKKLTNDHFAKNLCKFWLEMIKNSNN